MKELILLGAGASVDAGIPDANGMTKRILESFKSSSIQGKFYHILCFTIGGLLFQRGVNGQDPFEGVNIEDVFNAIELLGNRLELEAAPFIGSWHPLIDELDVIRVQNSIYASMVSQMGNRSMADRLDRDIERMLKGQRPFNRVGETVLEMIHGSTPLFAQQSSKDKNTDRPGKGRLFLDTNEYMIKKLVSLTWVRDSKKVAYLEPLARFAQTQNSAIATLNYDNSIELAATSCNIVADTGLAHWSETGSIAFDGSSLPLMKLHGSIDWRAEDRPMDDNHPLPYQLVRKATQDEMVKGGFHPAVVFGGRNKLTASGPFLEVLRAFQETLGRVRVLTIIGYSFGDAHINECIRQWVNGLPSRTVRIITQGSTSNQKRDFAKQIQSMKNRVTILTDGATEGIRILFGKDS